jgi:hypothetical protein
MGDNEEATWLDMVMTVGFLVSLPAWYLVAIYCGK